MNIAARLEDTIYVQTPTGSDGAGDPVWSAAARAIKARVEGDSRLLVSPQGNEQQANHKIATLDPITSDDRVWLPGVDTSDESKAKRPILVQSASPFGGGLILYEVFL